MRWLKFTAAGNTSWGLVEGDKVITVSGDPFGEWQRTAQSHALGNVKIETKDALKVNTESIAFDQNSEVAQTTHAVFA